MGEFAFLGRHKENGCPNIWPKKMYALRQFDRFLSKLGHLANFPAGFVALRGMSLPAIAAREPALFLNPQWHDFRIYLESAAFVFHMMPAARDPPGHCELRVLKSVVLSPSNGFLACPFQLNNAPTPQTRVSRTHPRALAIPVGRLLFCYGKNHPFDLLSGFRPRRSHRRYA